MRRPRRRSPFVLLLAASLTGFLLPATAHGEESTSRRVLVRHEFRAGAGEVRDFWTKARMRKTPPMPEPGATPHFEVDAWSTAVRTELSTPLASQLPDAPFKRKEIVDPSEAPYRVHGKLFVQAGRAEYHCSATVLKSANESVVFTAGHCLYGEDLGGWVDSVAFVPGYLYGNRPYGTWIADAAFVTPSWKQEESARGDIGALVMQPLNGESIVDAVGGRSIAVGEPRDQSFEAFGYPAAGGFDGERLYVCIADAFAKDSSPSGTGPDPTGIGCDQTQGASGGGWVINGSALNSVNSYGYRDDDGNDLPYMFGPYFGSMARALYTEAETVPVEIPQPLPSVSVTPTEHPTTSPSPSSSPTSAEPPSVPTPRNVVVTDENDSRGWFDIAAVSVSEEAGTVTVHLKTHDDWRLRLLSPRYPRNMFFIDFDSVGGDREDYYLAVFSRNGRMIGRIHDYAPGADPVVGQATLSRYGPNGFKATVPGALLQLQTKLGWYASSYFKSATRCPRGCQDFAPNRTMVRM